MTEETDVKVVQPKIVLPSLPLGGCGTLIAFVIAVLLVLKLTVFPNIAYAQVLMPLWGSAFLILVIVALFAFAVLGFIGLVFGGAWLVDKHEQRANRKKFTKWEKRRAELRAQIENDGTEQFLDLRGRSSVQNMRVGKNTANKIRSES